MATQPAETEKTDDFNALNLLLGLAIGFIVLLAWRALIDALQVPDVSRDDEASLPVRLMSLLHTSLAYGFFYGAGSIARLNRPMSFLGLVFTAVFRALLGGLAVYIVMALDTVLMAAFGSAMGDTLYWGLLGILFAFAVASPEIVKIETEVKSLQFREYWRALFRLSRRATLRWIVWTIGGGYLGFLSGLALNHLISLAEFVLLILPVASWGLWWGKPAIVFEASRRNNAIRAIISAVAVVGPILLMTFNLQFGLMVAVSVILLYAVITLRK